MNRHLCAAVAVAGAAVIAITGCGGSGKDGGGSASASVTIGPLSKAEFIKQGDAICDKAKVDLLEEAKSFLEENGVDGSHPPSKAQGEEVITNVLLPRFRAQLQEIAALGAPKGEVDEVQAILDTAEAEADEVEADPRIESGADPFHETNAKAKDFGFKSCDNAS